jgi:DNA-binding LytR/AlgR family response regulator
VLIVLLSLYAIAVILPDIVNVAQVAASTRDLSGRVQVKLKSRPESLPVSRAFAQRFRQM